MPWTNDGFVIDENNTEQESEAKNIFTTNTTSNQLEEDQPRANEPFPSIGIASPRGEVLNKEQRVRKTRETGQDAIFNRLRQSPEILSIFQAIVDDVIGPGATFTYVGREDTETSDTESIKRAKRFWRRNQDEYANAMIDELAVGDRYLYKRTKDEAEVQDAAETLLRTNFDFNYKTNLKAASRMVTQELKEETNMFEIEELQHVPAITVEHDINRHGDITNYVQEIGADKVILPGDQVMHDSFMNLNGKTYGFTPFISLFTEIDMLANAKNHNAQIFDNAGVVNKIFKLPNEGPNGQNYEMVKQTIAKYRQLRNKHRDLVLTGNIEIEDMNSQGEAMDFKNLATYITNVIVMAWGIPPTRIGTGVGGGGGRGRSTQLAHEGYFKRIRRLQRSHAAFLNEELFEPVFNVHIQFNHPDTKQEIRQADRDLRKIDVGKQMVALGAWDKQKFMDYMDVDRTEENADFDGENLQERAMEMAGLQDRQLDDETVNGDSAEDAARMDLQEGQNQQEIENDGTNNDQ